LEGALDGMDRPTKVKTNAFAFHFIGLPKAPDCIGHLPFGDLQAPVMVFSDLSENSSAAGERLRRSRD
jgi:hypothetical protein